MTLNEKPQITYADFEKLDLRVGRILTARVNEKARKPAYVLEIDFGSKLGIKRTSAQIVAGHTLEGLIGMQVIAVVNFPPKKVADVVSEVLVLGVVQEEGPVILLTSSQPVVDGSPVG